MMYSDSRSDRAWDFSYYRQRSCDFRGVKFSDGACMYDLEGVKLRAHFAALNPTG